MILEFFAWCESNMSLEFPKTKRSVMLANIVCFHQVTIHLIGKKHIFYDVSHRTFAVFESKKLGAFLHAVTIS